MDWHSRARVQLLLLMAAVMQLRVADTLLLPTAVLRLPEALDVT